MIFKKTKNGYILIFIPILNKQIISVLSNLNGSKSSFQIYLSNGFFRKWIIIWVFSHCAKDRIELWIEAIIEVIALWRWEIFQKRIDRSMSVVPCKIIFSTSQDSQLPKWQTYPTKKINLKLKKTLSNITKTVNNSYAIHSHYN